MAHRSGRRPVLAVCLLTSILGLPASAGQWVGTWTSSQQRGDSGNAPPPPGLAGATLRQVVHVSLGGAKLRVRLSNEFGDTALELLGVRIARSTGGAAIVPATDRALTFQGEPSVSIPAGAPILSDPLAFDLPPLADVSISIFLKSAPAALTTHPGARTPSFFAAGDATSAADLPDAARVEHWYFLSGIDVWAGDSAASIVTLGDSITDGRNSTANGRWPDDLARRLHAARKTARVGVLNAGIGGNCVVNGGLGPSALARFDRDVLSQSGVRWLIVFEGVNDLGGKPSADPRELIAAYTQIVERAHAHSIRVYGATILPIEGSFYFRPEVEAARQTVNTWIRTSRVFDAVIDLDLALRDPASPGKLLPAADSGDRLHPHNAGYRMIAAAIALRNFER